MFNNKFIVALISAILFLIADASSAYWGKTLRTEILLLTLITAPLGYICFGLLNRVMPLGTSSALVNILIICGGVIIGKFLFMESLSIYQYIGILLALVSISLMAY